MNRSLQHKRTHVNTRTYKFSQHKIRLRYSNRSQAGYEI